MEMDELQILNAKYAYIHDDKQAINMHHIIVRKSGHRQRQLGCFICFCTLLFLATVFSLKYPSVAIIIWSTLLAMFIPKSSLLKSVEKESVVVMPAFGVQLETHYGSGRIIRRFVPVGKIVKPVLNECVTPLTCYWTLSLFLQDEEELMLVFKELRPPVKMLVPIWKSLCALTDSVERSDTYQEEEP